MRFTDRNSYAICRLGMSPRMCGFVICGLLKKVCLPTSADQTKFYSVVRKSCEIYGTYFFQVRDRGLREGATHLLVASLHVPTHNNRVVFLFKLCCRKTRINMYCLSLSRAHDLRSTATFLSETNPCLYLKSGCAALA